ncbi:tRNA uridine-5-carboxymethylaminomethyl(34) synthesis GTPase MnmE [Mycoplasmopsis meleagridis]|uniref:tRNA uridine-5-carboxymethylaminomethyl(34) synthesis GTPase MnmE n=1 Tax=Mycoplasmopsis meleagridis TaxID=29561 RepID=UPI00073D9669|nr:tRNA uridine-5-carboxymethylaminomethyl(34) synthesis GTPase MnmE [Mycoplasmopsis meleagridis]KUH47552.1 tRNA modification GTPase TrmE [Mycoplasmopsis meleagridis]
MFNDTIAAISSGGKINQAISIIRISGPESVSIVKKLFTGKIGQNRQITYGNIVNNFDNNKLVDEVLIAWFIGNNTFTGEDTVEINCHGGIVITNRILELILANGARMALPGEFSRRAFLNGKMDLIKAEAINELIHATTLKQTEYAVKKFDGKTSELINNLVKELMFLIGQIEVNIDYPEYDDVENILNNNLLEKLENFSSKLNKIIDSSQNSRLIFEGIKVAILGKPNVGKSSILNCLLNEEKAIVTDEAGTTRDIIEASYQINGILFKLIDTAGIRKTDLKIEKIGIEKAFEQIKKADIIIHVFDPKQEENEFDKKVDLEALNLHKKLIKVINKTDLIDQKNYKKGNYVFISAIKKDIDNLKNELVNSFNLDNLTNDEFVNNARQLSLIIQAKNNIDEAINALKNGLDADLTIVDIRRAWANLVDISGRADNEDLLDEMFKNFCLGK